MPLDSNMEQQPTQTLKTKDPNKYQQPPPPPPHSEMLSLSEFVMETKGTQKYILCISLSVCFFYFLFLNFHTLRFVILAG